MSKIFFAKHILGPKVHSARHLFILYKRTLKTYSITSTIEELAVISRLYTYI
jgi:hypothetical protein